MVYAQKTLRERACQLACHDVIVLSSLKACSLIPVQEVVAEFVGGVSASSLFEARLAGQLVGEADEIQFVSCALKPCEIARIANYCDTLIANELRQFRMMHDYAGQCRFGLRLKTGVGIVNDVRYDPCRKHSKLGIPLAKTSRAWREGDLKDISGIHFHTACCTTSWEPLLRTVRVIEKQLAPMMHELEWINLGGGYEWDETTDFGPLQETIDLLTNTYGLKVFLEPGSGIVNSAGLLISSVVDLFESDGKMVAILDTTVNHLPEVFEFQYEPDVAEDVDDGPHKYILAGCSCLAGDLFGEYTFEEPLDIGSRITFENVGAYSLVKANMFNGINLPSIYIRDESGKLDLVREFTYEDFLSRCGGEEVAAIQSTSHDTAIPKRPEATRLLGKEILAENGRRQLTREACSPRIKR